MFLLAYVPQLERVEPVEIRRPPRVAISRTQSACCLETSKERGTFQRRF